MYQTTCHLNDGQFYKSCKIIHKRIILMQRMTQLAVQTGSVTRLNEFHGICIFIDEKSDGIVLHL